MGKDDKNGILPTFLGLGVQKGGTTWLYELLKSHPDVYLPEYRKEMHFFDNDEYYSRGQRWYRSFFPSRKKAVGFSDVGEITPKYIFDEKVPARVKKYLPHAKFIVVLRNPVDRFVSAYKYGVQNGATWSFSRFYHHNRNAFERGLYSRQLERWFSYFSRDRFLILFFEEAIEDPEVAKRQLSEFLDVKRSGFPDSVSKKNASFDTRFKRLYRRIKKSSKWLRRKGLDIVVETLKPVIERLFAKKTSSYQIDQRLVRQLYRDYENEIARLEKLLGRDLYIWREQK